MLAWGARGRLFKSGHSDHAGVLFGTPVFLFCYDPYGSGAAGIYLLLGATGVPVFAGFHGGAQTLVGPSGGFLWGFLGFAFLCGLARRFDEKRNKCALVLFSALGLLVCHACGVLQYMLVTGNNFWSSVLLVSVPYLIKDAVSVVLAYIFAKKILRRISPVFPKV